MKKFVIISAVIFSALEVIDSTQGVCMENAQAWHDDADKLKSKIAQTDLAIKNLGGNLSAGLQRTGFGAYRDDEDSDKKSLFQIHSDLKRLRLSTGKLLFGRTITRLVVTSESPAIIQLDVAQGSFSELRLMGSAHASSTPGRLIIEFQKILLSNGNSVSLQATALDENGAHGLVAQVFSQKALSVAGAMASSFVSGLAASQQTQSSNAFGFTQTQPTGRNAILQGVAQTAADQSKRLIDEAFQEKPVLVVEAGTELTILIQEDVRF